MKKNIIFLTLFLTLSGFSFSLPLEAIREGDEESGDRRPPFSWRSLCCCFSHRPSGSTIYKRLANRELGVPLLTMSSSSGEGEQALIGSTVDYERDVIRMRPPQKRWWWWPF